VEKIWKRSYISKYSLLLFFYYIHLAVFADVKILLEKLLLCRTTEKQKGCYWTHHVNDKKQSKGDKNWTGSFGHSVAGTWGAEDFIAV